MRSRCTLSILLVLVALAAQSASGRDRLLVVGSSTVYPFAVRVGEEFVGSTGQPTPEIRGTGTGEGFRLFCTGAGESHPDVVNASRRLTKAEWDLCAANGVTDLVEIKIGYDGIVVANAKRAPFISLSSKQIFLALAETVPLDGDLVSNPYKRWIEISLTLPSYPIRVLGPPTSSGTRDAFVQLAMTKGCETFTVLQELKRSDVDAYRKVCGTLRTDGPYVESGEDDALIVDQLDEDRSALGIFGYSFLDRNRDRIKGSAVNGEEPTSSTIGQGIYPLSRPLYIYFKRSQVEKMPGLRQYIAEFTNEWSLGPEGYLIEEGLIPLHKQERKENYLRARHRTVLLRDDL